MTSSLLQNYARFDLEFEAGEGAYLTTVDGRQYLDFAGGIAVTVAGHAHPHLVAALTDQATRLWHTSNLYHIPGQERLASRLTEATFADQVFFCNSGAEAVECALKAARRYHHVSGAPERYRVITFEGAFHGRTLATISAAGQSKYLDGFGPPMDGFDHVPLGDMDAVRNATGPHTAAVLIEPVQGEGGIRVVEPSFLRALRSHCDEHGLLLLLDEVQSGMGRTGRLFAHEWAGIAPDVMAIAKGIGGGFPLGACLMTADAGAAMTAGSHGSTFGGNPLAMAVGNAVMDLVLEPDFLGHVQGTALRLKQGLAGLRDEYPSMLEEIRGEGLMCGLKVGPPAPDFARALLDEHMLTVGAGENVVRLLPPLIIGEAEVEACLKAVRSACARLSDPS